uniref:Uncharacterized protein n=1 Tax=viral metagenome TaxID=1070528 RepID=A0A6M3JPH2_9ZZZZ
MAKYLRQMRTGRVYVYDETLAKRKDMVDHDPDMAKRMIEAKKKRLEEVQAMRMNPDLNPPVDPSILSDSEELAKIEAALEEEERKLEELLSGGPKPEDVKPKTDEDIALERRQEIINKDPDIAKIEAMTEKKHVEAYVMEEFGVDIDLRKGLPTLKADAIQLRVDRLFET